MTHRPRSGALGMHEGDRVVHADGRHGIADEFLQDGDAAVTWDDGTSDMVKWRQLYPELNITLGKGSTKIKPFMIMKGVPLPALREKEGYRQRHSKYPFRRMDVGDCFDFPPGKDIREYSTVVSYAGYKLGREFVCRTLSKNGKKFVRCWRVR